MVSIIRRYHLIQKLTFKRRFIGIYSMIFAAFIRIRLKRRGEPGNGSKTLLYLVIANFIACTAYVALDLIVCSTNRSIWDMLASDILYTCIDLISQVTLVSYLHTTLIRSPLMRVALFSMKIYRCWVLWRRPWVMVIPILLTVAFLGANLHNLD